MPNINAPDIPTPEVQPPAPLARTMAYGSGHPAPNSTIVSQLHRLRRGFPYQRAGISVLPIPQFKAVNVYSHTLATRASSNPVNTLKVPAPFQNTTTPTLSPVYSWPIGSRS